MNIKLTIPERLKDLRIERGLTLEQLSEATGISRAALGKYEADDFKDISPFSIAALAAEGRTRILDSQCVDVSYPTFYDTFEELL